MSDIFLSYAREDWEVANALAKRLEERWSVWWDPQIVGGERFHDVIEAQLNAARCVIVLWSRASVASDFVKAEAHEALRLRKLVPALIDDLEQPFGFRQVNAISLLAW